MSAPSSRPQSNTLQRKYFPNTLHKGTNTYTDSPPKTLPKTPMISTTRNSNIPTNHHRLCHDLTPSPYLSDHPTYTLPFFTESPTSARSGIMELRPSSPNNGPLDPDYQPDFSPIIPIHRSDSDNEDEDEHKVDLSYDNESDWQDAQVRESQLSRVEDEEEWVDPLEGIFEAPLIIEEWNLIDEEEGNDDWSDDDDWCGSGDIQDEWVEMTRVEVANTPPKKRREPKQKAS